MKRFASTFAALALLTAVGQAAPLDSKNVAADAKWVVHVDVDAVRDSQRRPEGIRNLPLVEKRFGQAF